MIKRQNARDHAVRLPARIVEIPRIDGLVSQAGLASNTAPIPA